MDTPCRLRSLYLVLSAAFLRGRIADYHLSLGRSVAECDKPRPYPMLLSQTGTSALRRNESMRTTCPRGARDGQRLNLPNGAVQLILTSPILDRRNLSPLIEKPD